MLWQRTRKPANGPLDPEKVRAAVGAVQDPELHRGLAELGMLRDIEIGRDGRARVEVALTTPACPLRDTLRDEVTAAATAAGAAAVEVVFTSMNERERMDLARQVRGERPKGLDERTRVYAVASGKGGVGKSSVTANLAVALAHSGQRVGVLDADVWGYSVPQLFGIRRSPVALNGIMLPIESYGVRLISVGFFVDDSEPVVWRGPMLHKALEQFLTDVYWDDLDVLLVDLPPGTGDVTLSLLELLPQAALLAVTTPQPAAQNVASRVGRMARDQRMPIAGVVENMSELVCDDCGSTTPVFGSGGGQRLADEIGAPLLAQIPLDLALRQAGDDGAPVVASAPDTPSATALAKLAGDLPVVRRSLAGRQLPLTVV